ncbi:MAG: insulinase family protein [Candidatus Glassbacteria bacterium]|nr:insulinase family protein [Candidatus Glassbacteria bacterium]
MFKIIILAVTALCAMAVYALPKETPPPGGEPKKFVLPSRRTFTLENGLAVTLVPFGSTPKVAVELVLAVGNINENEDQVWLADLTGMMLEEGTTSLGSEQIAEKIAGMGGQLDIGVGPDQTTVMADVLAEFGSEAVRIIADVVRNPLLPTSEIERLKNDLIRRASIQRSRAQSQALEKYREVLYGNHPYGRVFPSENILQSFTLQDVKNFYGENFGAARARLYVAGVFDQKSMEASIRESFSGWESGPAATANIPSPESKREVHLVNRPGAVQSTIYMGLPTIGPRHEDWLELNVTNFLLGGMFASRITANIREDKGYTYSPRSSISVRYGDAYWAETADVTTEVTGEALKEIFYEIDRLQGEPPSAEELQGVQNYAAGRFVLQNSDRGGIIGMLAYLDLHGLPVSYLENYTANVMKITPEQVQAAARNYIRDTEMTIVVVGDSAAIAEQISRFGPVVQ